MPSQALSDLKSFFHVAHPSAVVGVFKQKRLTRFSSLSYAKKYYSSDTGILSGETLIELRDIGDPVLVESSLISRVIEGAVASPKEGDEVIGSSRLDPAVVVLLHREGAFPRLLAVGLVLRVLREASVLPPCATILLIPDGGDDGRETLTHLWANVHGIAHSLLKGRSEDFAILGLDSLGCFDKR